MTKKTILEKALELFSTKGYNGTSMGDIAEAVGIRKASLYSHFDGKESIFAAIFDDILAEYVNYINDLTVLPEEMKTSEKLRTVFLSFIMYCKDNLKMYFWDRYFYYPPDFLKDYISEKTLETQQVFIERITVLIEEGIRKGEVKSLSPQELALAFYYLMIGLSMSVKLYDRAGLERNACMAIGGFLTGILNE